MSLEAMLWALRVNARRANVSDAAHLTLIALANNAHEDGRNAFPSAATLAGLRSLNVRTLRRHLAELETAGLIRRGDDRMVAHIPPNRRPVVWDLALSPVPGVTDMSPQAGLWGDTHWRSGVTPDVTQTVIEPSDLSNHLATTARARARATEPMPPALEEYPGRECFHGVEAVTVKTRDGVQYKCPDCRRRRYLVLAPPPPEPSPEQVAHVEQFLAGIRQRREERNHVKPAHR